MTTIKLILVVVAARGWNVHQLDIDNFFLHGDLFEDVYMHPPLGYQVPIGHVCKLSRSLYGLAIGFHQSWHDYSLFGKVRMILWLSCYFMLMTFWWSVQEKMTLLNLNKLCMIYSRLKISVKQGISWAWRLQDRW